MKYIIPLGFLVACSTNHPVTVTPDAVQLSQYLEAHPSSELQVTDTAGHRYWLYDPVVQNDSLIGVKSRAEPDVHRGLGLGEIQGLEQPEFDAAKSAGLGALIFAGMATFVATVIDDGQGVIYANDVGEE